MMKMKTETKSKLVEKRYNKLELFFKFNWQIKFNMIRYKRIEMDKQM